MRVLDLFAGCGGLSCGIERAELNEQTFDIVAGLDFDKSCMETFRMNHPDAHDFCLDIRKTEVKDILEKIGKIDILIGGPSCQGFSTHGKRVADDPRNFLYQNFMRFVEQANPKWVLMENVTGLLRYNNGEFRDNILEDFKRLGFSVSFAQLQASDYGVPQVRKRVFFVANRLNIPFFFPKPTHRNPLLESSSAQKDIFGDVVKTDTRPPYVTLREAIGDLPIIGLGSTSEDSPSEYAYGPSCGYQRGIRGKTKVLTQHYGKELPPENLKRVKHIPKGGDWLDIPKRLLPERFKNILKKDATTLFFRLRWDRPAYTITTVYRNVSSGPFTHPDEDRALTHREAMRIQSFPDYYKFSNSLVSRQVGNAVPPILAEQIGLSILAHDQNKNIFKRSGIDKFRESVELTLDASKKRSRTKSIEKVETPLPELKNGLSKPPITDSQWESITQAIKPYKIVGLSQINMRGVVNSILAIYDNEGSISESSNKYQEDVTVLRILNSLHKSGNLINFMECVSSALKGTKRKGAVSDLGHELKKPTRARVRPNSAHHFATIHYEISPDTLSVNSSAEIRV